MFNVGTPELLVILLVALIVLGPQKLPEAARRMGEAMSEFRRMSAGFQAELRDALHEPVEGTPSMEQHPMDVQSAGHQPEGERAEEAAGEEHGRLEPPGGNPLEPPGGNGTAPA